MNITEEKVTSRLGEIASTMKALQENRARYAEELARLDVEIIRLQGEHRGLSGLIAKAPNGEGGKQAEGKDG